MLTWTELCEVVLDVEIALNNRLLCYFEDDIQLPVLTPKSLLFLRSNHLPELEPHHLREFDLRRLPNIYEGWENDTGWNTEVNPRPWPKERWSSSRTRNEIAINGKLESWKIWFRDETESFELPSFERGKEHSNGYYNTLTHRSCPAIGRTYRLLRNSNPKPRHSGPEGMQR